MRTETGTRLFAVDNLRVLLTALVVAHHVAVTYGDIPLWYYTEPAADPSGTALDILVVFNQAFFMGFFFLISGFFTPGSHDRKGGRAFVRDRLVRLGVPLLVFLLLLRPLLTIGEHGMPFWKWYIVSWDPGPMWFVEVLIVFALLYAWWRRAGRSGAQKAGAQETGVQEAGAPSLKGVVLFTLGLAAATLLWRIPVPQGTYVPVLGLPTPYFLPQYAAMFAAGVVAFRRGWFGALPRRAGRAGFVVAGVATVLLLPPAALTTGLVAVAINALWESVFAVGMIVGLVVLFRERFDRQGPRGRFLSANAYAVYVLHPLVLVAAAWAVRGLHAAAVVKFALVLAVSLPLCWGLAYAVRSLPGARRVL
ncbi:acyltransferase family protein [Nonomuraea sp. NPDC049684]|uniref:acyltransferase family protein n=1 Tax=Nonomuraea sp. NPDC049684 TaxID=3364356 RepID=UPI0037A04C79